jgi:ubiquinone/menaquinone biosynthesis C-methylase UbiE
MNQNKRTYESPKMIKIYKGLNKLFPSEKVLFRIVQSLHRKNAMLDLGIGGGRTTGYFSSLFKKYIGIDFSNGMIETCKGKFKKSTNIEFIVADAAQLPVLSETNFDFIFFSLNGISYLKNLEERNGLISTIYKLLDDHGIFAFSAHNAKAIQKLYSFQLPKRNPLRLINHYFHYRKIRKINGSVSNYSDKKFFQLYDGGEYFKAFTSYILPSYQIELLKNAGFKNIQALDQAGTMLNIDEIDQCEDYWIHYFCYKK